MRWSSQRGDARRGHTAVRQTVKKTAKFDKVSKRNETGAFYMLSVRGLVLSGWLFFAPRSGWAVRAATPRSLSPSRSFNEVGAADAAELWAILRGWPRADLTLVDDTLHHAVARRICADARSSSCGEREARHGVEVYQLRVQPGLPQCRRIRVEREQAEPQDVWEVRAGRSQGSQEAGAQ